VAALAGSAKAAANPSAKAKILSFILPSSCWKELLLLVHAAQAGPLTVSLPARGQAGPDHRLCDVFLTYRR
jgi:hypothetical protein